jgi:nitroreductase
MFEIDVEWQKQIARRRSCRSYLPGPAGEAELARLRGRFGGVGRLDGARVLVVERGADAVLTGLVGSYGKIRGAESYAAFVLDPGVSGSEARLGRLGEALVLEATGLGLGTCWVAGTFDAERAARTLGIGASERVAAITPLGRPAQRGFWDAVARGAVGADRRKNLKELLLPGFAQAKWPFWAKSALEAARWAPSGRNRQPWRFLVRERSVELRRSAGEASWARPVLASVRLAPPPEERKSWLGLDLGIAALHLELGARAAGADVSWVEGEADVVGWAAEGGVKPGTPRSGLQGSAGPQRG